MALPHDHVELAGPGAIRLAEPAMRLFGRAGAFIDALGIIVEKYRRGKIMSQGFVRNEFLIR